VKGNKKAISRKISEFAVNLKYGYLPDNVVEQTKRFLYDSIGCAFGNMGTKDVNIFEKYLEYPKEDPREPMNIKDLRIKFNSLINNNIEKNRLKELENAIFSCEKYNYVNNFVKKLIILKKNKK